MQEVTRSDVERIVWLNYVFLVLTKELYAVMRTIYIYIYMTEHNIRIYITYVCYVHPLPAWYTSTRRLIRRSRYFQSA